MKPPCAMSHQHHFLRITLPKLRLGDIMINPLPRHQDVFCPSWILDVRNQSIVDDHGDYPVRCEVITWRKYRKSNQPPVPRIMIFPFFFFFCRLPDGMTYRCWHITILYTILCLLQPDCHRVRRSSQVDYTPETTTETPQGGRQGTWGNLEDLEDLERRAKASGVKREKKKKTKEKSETQEK